MTDDRVDLVWMQLADSLAMLRFMADWQEADGFLKDKIAQAKAAEPVTTLAAVEAAEKQVRRRRLPLLGHMQSALSLGIMQVDEIKGELTARADLLGRVAAVGATLAAEEHPRVRARPLPPAQVWPAQSGAQRLP
jgi:hypothetical protein